MALRACARYLTLLILFLAAAGPAVAQSGTSSIISGRVLDSRTNEPIVGASVTIDGLTFETVTDRDGVFRLPELPQGQHTLIVTYLGRKESRTALNSGGEVPTPFIVKLEPDATFHEEIEVTGLLQDAQQRALNQQKTAPNIINVVSADQIGHFPDANAAEVMQRVPGLSIQRDQGEGRYVIVRGTEARLNSMMINGERIPPPEADVRSVALDVVPADLLEAVEVSKALTPDMDGDSIGGSVNLITKKPVEKLSIFASAGGGYNTSLGSADQHNVSLSAGGRTFNNKAGFFLGTSFTGTTRGNEDFEPAYGVGNAAGTLADLDLRSYTVNRRRNGATGSVDFRPQEHTLFSVNGIYNYFIDDHEERQRLRNRVANTRLERELRDRTHVEHIWNLGFNGHHDMGNSTLEYHVQGAKSDQNDPNTIATVFRQSNVNFATNVTPTSIDPDNVQANPLNENLSSYRFNSQTQAHNTNSDRDIVGAVDLRYLGRTSPGLTAFFKAGVKYRDKHKVRTRDEVSLASATTIPLSAVLQSDGATHELLDGRYSFGPFMDLETSSNLSNAYPMTSTINHARDAEDSTTNEHVTAGYVMAEMFTGAKTTILPGLRLEYTSADYLGYGVDFSPSGAWLSTNPLTGSDSYLSVLPGINIRRTIATDTAVRGAVTRTLARANYIDLIPNRTFDDQNNIITVGNSSLRPTYSWNADVMIERYVRPIGLLSAGYFYKNLKDYIYKFTTTEIINGEQFSVTQPLNGDSASIHGLELQAQNQLAFLPPPFDGIGVYLNYTFTDSTAVFPGRTGEKASLPGQSRHVGNVAVSYEKKGFTGRVAMNFHGSYIDMVGAESGLDRFYDTHKQLDLSFTQRLMRNASVYFNALNLTDAPLRYFQGVPDRPLQEEHYQWWSEFGVKVNWKAN